MRTEEIETANDAFDSAITPKELNGIELKPFSLLRKNVAYQLGITGEPENIFFDSVIIAWLMSQSDREVAQALRDKEKAIVAAFAWAEERGFHKDKNRTLIELLKRIMRELNKSTDIESNENGIDSGNVGRPPAT
jgi:hypothetical protein